MLDWVRVAGLSCTLKGFGIYMIEILGSSSDVVEASPARSFTHHVRSLVNITRVWSQPSFSFCP